jgi:transposase InsO family protein
MTGNSIKKGEDSTLSKNTVSYWKYLISEYHLVKEKKHPRFRFVTDLYKCHKIKRQNFIKYYNRYKDSNYTKDLLLLPQKRGPRYSTKRILPELENKIVDLRIKNKLNKFEIHKELKSFIAQKKDTSKGSEENIKNCCVTTVYNVLKKHNLNKLKPGMQKQKVEKIVKENLGDMGHIDCHYLPRNIIRNDNNRYYLVGIMDDCSRLIWVDVVDNIKSLNVMFATLSMLNLIRSKYNIEFLEMLSDNGKEFTCGKNKDLKTKRGHAFERLLIDLNIKHRYIRPYRPQTNGKIERLWRTMKEDLLEDMVFDSFDHLREEVMKYCLYYNEYRPHSSLKGKTPLEFSEEKTKNKKEK